jgi:hypothetical protein
LPFVPHRTHDSLRTRRTAMPTQTALAPTRSKSQWRVS